MGHPKIAEAAVIGVAHPKWAERPLACVVVKPGEELTKDEVLAFLDGQGRQVVAARRRRVRRRDPQDQRRQVLEEGPAGQVRRLRAADHLAPPGGRGGRGHSLGAVRWRFALTPKWIIRHVLVVALVVTMVLLGFWQLRRLDEKREYKALVEARQEEPIADVEAVVPADAAVGSAAVDGVLYRTVRGLRHLRGGRHRGHREPHPERCLGGLGAHSTAARRRSGRRDQPRLRALRPRRRDRPALAAPRAP